MRFVFINRFYWPDEPATAQLLTDLAEGLAAAGHTVNVIASHPGGDVPAAEIRRNVAVRRVRGTRIGKRGLVGKFTDFASFFLGALWVAFRTLRQGDTAVAMTDPPMLGLGIWAVARLRRARVVHWVQDIYPEIAVELTGQRWLRALQPPRNLAWRRADACVVLGTDMARVLAGAGVESRRVGVCPNWAPAGLGPMPPDAADELRSAWDLGGKFVVLYSGNLGRVHDLMPLLDVAERLREHPRIALVFVGAGAQLPGLKSAAAERELKNVRFFPPQPRGSLARSLSLGDLHLVTVLPGCESFVFPSKFYGIAAVGRPMLFMGPPGCEVASLVERNRIGRVFARDQPDAIAAEILSMSGAPDECVALGRAAADFSRKLGGAEAAIRRWAELAESLGPA